MPRNNKKKTMPLSKFLPRKQKVLLPKQGRVDAKPTKL